MNGLITKINLDISFLFTYFVQGSKNFHGKSQYLNPRKYCDTPQRVGNKNLSTNHNHPELVFLFSNI